MTNEIKNKENEGDSEKERQRQLNSLVMLISAFPDLVLFRDQNDEPCIRLPVIDGGECFGLKSKRARSFVRSFIRDRIDIAITDSTLDNIISSLEAEALFGNEKFELHCRVAKHNEQYWYDLGSEAIRVAPFQTEWVEFPPILFRKYQLHDPQVKPDFSEPRAIKKLLELFEFESAEDELLLVAFIISSLVSDIAHPILVLHGPQGSGKTILTRMIQSLIDPQKTEDCPHYNIQQLSIQARQRWLVPLDNVSRINQELSDFLCKVVTGAAIAERVLYTNGELDFCSFRRPIIINGIASPLDKPDILDRSILLALDRIPDTKRRTEAEIFETFNALKPKLLGSCLYLLSQALGNLRNVKLDRFPRLADFGRWGAAIAVAYGSTQESFLRAIELNQKRQNDESIAASPIAAVLISFMSTRTDFQGTASQLLTALKSHEPEKFDPKLLPLKPNSLSRKLKEIKPNLESEGIEVTYGRSKDRLWKIIRKNIVDTVEPTRTESNQEVIVDDTVDDIEFESTPSWVYDDIDDITDDTETIPSTPKYSKTISSRRFVDIDDEFPENPHTLK